MFVYRPSADRKQAGFSFIVIFGKELYLISKYKFYFDRIAQYGDRGLNTDPARSLAMAVDERALAYASMEILEILDVPGMPSMRLNVKLK